MRVIDSVRLIFGSARPLVQHGTWYPPTVLLICPIIKCMHYSLFGQGAESARAGCTRRLFSDTVNNNGRSQNAPISSSQLTSRHQDDSYAERLTINTSTLA